MKLNKIEQNKAAKDGLDVGPEIDTFAQLGWENVDKTDLELRLKWYGMFWRPKTPGKFMLRLRVPNGVLHFNQLEVRTVVVVTPVPPGTVVLVDIVAVALVAVDMVKVVVVVDLQDFFLSQVHQY